MKEWFGKWCWEFLLGEAALHYANDTPEAMKVVTRYCHNRGWRGEILRRGWNSYRSETYEQIPPRGEEWDEAAYRRSIEDFSRRLKEMGKLFN